MKSTSEFDVSNVLLNSYAVYKVSTFETSNSLVDFKLFGPLYSAGKGGLGRFR